MSSYCPRRYTCSNNVTLYGKYNTLQSAVWVFCVTMFPSYTKKAEDGARLHAPLLLGKVPRRRSAPGRKIKGACPAVPISMTARVCPPPRTNGRGLSCLAAPAGHVGTLLCTAHLPACVRATADRFSAVRSFFYFSVRFFRLLRFILLFLCSWYSIHNGV